MENQNELLGLLRAHGEQTRTLLIQLRAQVAAQPDPQVPHSTVSEPMQALDEAQRLLQSGQMWLQRAITQPTDF